MFPSGFKPMLASNEQPDTAALSYPLFASPKLDGWRCVTSDPADASGQPRLFSRKLEVIPNRAAQRQFAHVAVHLDGELVTYTDGKADPLDVVQSKLSKAEGEHDVRFHVFDTFAQPQMPYRNRLQALDNLVAAHIDILTPVPVITIANSEQLARYRDYQVDECGEEGVMTRRPDGLYKFGRSTLKEETLLKLKRFLDAEGTIVAMRERMSNQNEATKDALGNTKRSSAAAGKVGLGTMGSFDVEWEGITFSLGGGALDDKRRAELWAMGRSILGRKVTFKYQRKGPNGKPLLPGFLALREDV